MACHAGRTRTYQDIALNILPPLLLRRLRIIDRQILSAKELNRDRIRRGMLLTINTVPIAHRPPTYSTLYRFSSGPTTPSACILYAIC